jgi:hypothetical protein
VCCHDEQQDISLHRLVRTRATVLLFGDAIGGYILTVFISEPVPQTEDIGTDCGVTDYFKINPFSLFAAGAIVLFPIATVVGFIIVWLNNRRLDHNALPHQMPSTIWRK